MRMLIKKIILNCIWMFTFQSLPKYLLWVDQHNENQCNTCAELKYPKYYWHFHQMFTVKLQCHHWFYICRKEVHRGIECTSTSLNKNQDSCKNYTHQFLGLFDQVVLPFPLPVFLSIFWLEILHQSFYIVLWCLAFFALQSMELTGYQCKNAAIFSSISCLFVCNNQSVGNQGGNGMAWVTFPWCTMVWLVHFSLPFQRLPQGFVYDLLRHIQNEWLGVCTHDHIYILVNSCVILSCYKCLELQN